MSHQLGITNRPHFQNSGSNVNLRLNGNTGAQRPNGHDHKAHDHKADSKRLEGFSPSAELGENGGTEAINMLLQGLIAALGMTNEENPAASAAGVNPQSSLEPAFGGSPRAGFSGNSAAPAAVSPATSNSSSGSGDNSSGEVGAKTGNIVDVPGGKVDASIADNVKKMMEAAKKDGIELKISSSFRSRAEQEKLYAAYQNGTGNLAAKPGSSNHESGLAIDFQNTTGAYDWLKKNAGQFGLKNLPSEPWHYSTTGT